MPAPSESKMNDAVVSGLRDLLSQHTDKRVLVVGTTCTGKSTLLAQVTGARDQDREIFPKLTPEESAYVCQTPWTEEIGRTMTRLVRERVQAQAGKPLFGTVVIDADLIILLKISDSLLHNRVASREAKFEDAKNMQSQIEREVHASGTPWVEYSVG